MEKMPASVLKVHTGIYIQQFDTTGAQKFIFWMSFSSCLLWLLEGAATKSYKTMLSC
jgi:hypothetical protein